MRIWNIRTIDEGSKIMATINRIEVFSIGMPLVSTFISGGVSNSMTRCLVVRVIANDATVGISSIDPSNKALSPNTVGELAVAIRERIGPALIGEDPSNVNKIVAIAYKLTPFQPGAIAGVELAN